MAAAGPLGQSRENTKAVRSEPKPPRLHFVQHPSGRPSKGQARLGSSSELGQKAGRQSAKRVKAKGPLLLVTEDHCDRPFPATVPPCHEPRPARCKPRCPNAHASWPPVPPVGDGTWRISQRKEKGGRGGEGLRPSCPVTVSAILKAGSPCTPKVPEDQPSKLPRS